MTIQESNRMEALTIAALSAILQSPAYSHFSAKEIAVMAVNIAESTFAEMERKRY
jgi:hypothetical protein